MARPYPGRAIVLFVMAVGVLGGVAVKYLTPDTHKIPNPRPIQFGAVLFVFVTAITMALGMKGAVPPLGEAWILGRCAGTKEGIDCLQFWWG